MSVLRSSGVAHTHLSGRRGAVALAASVLALGLIGVATAQSAVARHAGASGSPVTAVAPADLAWG
ncbi:hypothetical protein [Streptacidiphilus sp. P02-A3a]|uniref:hypothetical protein n=1 Tax=Streptacidiphilus sp. P02-A3a TaxID=2704468 RepID=UPI0015FD62E8|nr:hypothetical protein [Streptacidiphilus sp. P02-A3a]QMU71316.1 hypothetical protein GXP74_26885 [Streptacidiphilus sp. P02-A3a]